MAESEPESEPVQEPGSSICREVEEDSRWWDGYRNFPQRDQYGVTP